MPTILSCGYQSRLIGLIEAGGIRSFVAELEKRGLILFESDVWKKKKLSWVKFRGYFFTKLIVFVKI